jgi:hypothetical protein
MTDRDQRNSDIGDGQDQITRRRDALHDVMDLWEQHRLGEQPSMEDLVAMAEWLISGDTAPAERLAAAVIERAHRWQQQHGPDESTWTATGD